MARLRENGSKTIVPNFARKRVEKLADNNAVEFKNYAKMYGSLWFDDLYKKRKRILLLSKRQEQDMGMRATKEQTLGFLDEVEN